MTAAAVAALTVYDMVKGLERGVDDRGGRAAREVRRAQRRLAPRRRSARAAVRDAAVLTISDRRVARGEARGRVGGRCWRGSPRRPAPRSTAMEVVPDDCGADRGPAAPLRRRRRRARLHHRRHRPDARRRHARGDARGDRARRARLRRGDARRVAARTRRWGCSRAASPGIARPHADRQLPRQPEGRSTQLFARRSRPTLRARRRARCSASGGRARRPLSSTGSRAATASATALAGVSLTRRRAGATLVVFGPNGAGKSTLLRVLATLLRPHGGDGARARPRRCRARAGRCAGAIGLLGHEPLLYRDLTARENLRFHARLHGVADDARRRAAGRGRAARAAPTSRCARSRAGWSSASRSAARCCTTPTLLLLDEPRANLDPAAAELVEPLIGARQRAHARGHEPRPGAAGWPRPTSRSGCATGAPRCSPRPPRSTHRAIEELYR